MTIDKLDKYRMLISLKEDEMKYYDISIDKLNFKDEKCRASLMNLLRIACENSGVEFVGRAVLMEAMPHKEGMLILVTLDFVRKVYKVKRQKTMTVCRFDDTERLMDCVIKLKTENAGVATNSLWQYKEKLYLLLEFSAASPKAKAVLSEFSECLSLSLLGVARIKEAGRELIGSNATNTIAKSMGFC